MSDKRLSQGHFTPNPNLTPPRNDEVHFILKPFVEHFVQVDVAQQWTYHPALGCAFVFWVAEFSVLHHSGFQPLVY
jgi:hypothetical protein